MDKQGHDRINSIKARPTKAVSPNSGVAQPSDDILVEIRDDYREAKKQLKRYNKFIDKHPLATITISILLLLSLVVLLSVAYVLSNNGIMAYVSLGLIVVSLILVFVCFGRISSANKIERKMKELREEAAQYRHVVALGLSENNISREELGLFQESLKEESLATPQNEETAEESGGLILLGWIALIVRFFTSWGAISAISIIASMAALIISIILLASHNPTNKSNGKVILIIWIVIASIVFIVAFNNTQQARQTQVQPSYYSNYQ